MSPLEKAARAAFEELGRSDCSRQQMACHIARAVLLAVRFRDSDALHNKGRRFNREIDAILAETTTPCENGTKTHTTC